MSSHAKVRAQGRVPGQEARAARWDCSSPARTPKALRGTSEMELTRLSPADDERPRITFPDGRPGWGLSPRQERENQAMLAAADERNRQHAEECQARHAANLKRWNSPSPSMMGRHGSGAFTTWITSERESQAAFACVVGPRTHNKIPSRAHRALSRSAVTRLTTASNI